MKTFTAEEFNKSPAQVYREADKNGSVIKHSHYSDGFFLIKFVKTNRSPEFLDSLINNHLNEVKEEK